MTYARILIWRHGQTDWNAEYRWQGKTDIPLNEIGLKQAETAAAAIELLNPDAIVASPLQRARRTAEALAMRTNLPITTDVRLRETDGGVWEGMTQTEIRAQYAAEIEAWFADPHLPAGLNGESPAEVGERMKSAIEEHAKAQADGLLVVASHGGAARMGIISMMGLPPHHLSVFRVLNNCAWAVLEHEEKHGRWQLLEYNQLAAPPLPEKHI